MSNKIYIVVYLDDEEFDILKVFYSKELAEEFQKKETIEREENDRKFSPWRKYHSWTVEVQEHELSD